MRSLLLAFLSALAGCGEPTPELDAGSDPVDAGAPLDASADAGAGDPDGGPAPAGRIDGSCGVLDDELTDTSMSFLIENTMTFDEPWSSADAERVSEGAREILMEGTAGGSSGYSETFAFEVLHRCEGAELVKSETEIVYDTEGSLTDILVRLDGMKVGVSVTRAVTVTGECARADTYDEADAEDLLTRKLMGIAESSMNVSEADRWVKQILFTFADTQAHADTLQAVWDGLDPALRGDTILFVSVSEGMDGFIYFEDRCR